MTIELIKSTPVDLRSVGLDEKWLQDRIAEDPSILGLGELEIAGREHRQQSGGRIDFLMRDSSDSETYYEVEIMLGALDESHIIRTIEYWDLERQRRPHFDHYAVIVAENITSRYFNVLRLLNRAVPLIAIKLSSFQISKENIFLQFVTVLDVNEEIAGDDNVDQLERIDRSDWEKKADQTSIAMMDRIVSLLQGEGLQPKLTYNRHHVALATKGYNFCWVHPRKTVGRCHFEIRVDPDSRDTFVASLQEVGIDATPSRSSNIVFSIKDEDLNKNTKLILELLKNAERFSLR